MPKSKKKRGRPRRVDAARHPGGKIVQPDAGEREAAVKSVAEKARERVYKLSPSNAAKQEAGDVIGRAVLQGMLDKRQMLAAGEYERIVREFHAAIGAGKPGSPGDLNRVRGYDGGEGNEESYVKRCNEARQKMAESRRVLLDACNDVRDPLIQFAVNTWALEGEEAYNLLPSLRIGLNALAKLYQVDRWQAEGKAA